MGIFDGVDLQSPTIKRMMINSKTMMQQSLRAMLVDGEIDVGTNVAELLDKLDTELAELRGLTKPVPCVTLDDDRFQSLRGDGPVRCTNVGYGALD